MGREENIFKVFIPLKNGLKAVVFER